MFAGELDYLPKITDFKSFFYKHGIPPNKETRHLYLKGDMDSIIPEGVIESSIKSAILKGANMPFERKEAYIYLSNFFQIALHFLWDIMAKGSASCVVPPNELVAFDIKLARDEVHNFYVSNQNKIDIGKLALERNIDFVHDGSLPLAIFAFLLDLEKNHTELHQRLRQCKCCGEFWIRPSGGPWEFCTTKCKNTFHEPGREKDNEQKKKKREDKKRKEKPKIIKHIMENKIERIYDDEEEKYVFRHVSKEQANQIYDEAEQRSQKNTSSLAEFIRTTGKDW